VSERSEECAAVQKTADKILGSFSSLAGRTLCSALHELAGEIGQKAQPPEVGPALFLLGSACEKLAVYTHLPLEPTEKRSSAFYAMREELAIQRPKPTPEERIKNKRLARDIAREAIPLAKDVPDAVLDADPFCLWLEAIIHDVREEKR
jgi:hypothetical protein